MSTIKKKYARVISSYLPEIVVSNIYYLLRIKEFRKLKNTINLIYKNNYNKTHEEQLLSNILEYANRSSKYYNKVLKKIESIDEPSDAFEKLRKIPILNKDIIRDNMNELKVYKFDKLKKLKMNTGGTTGDPFEFYRSLEQGVIDRVCLERLYKDMGYKRGDLIVTFNGDNVSKKRIDNNIFWDRRGNNIPYGSIYFSSIYLNDDNISIYVEQLNNLKPDIIRGYPSFIYDVGKFIIENNIKLSNNIKGIQLTSEMTSEEQLEVIKKAFNTRVYFQYGHSEACIFGFADEDMKYYCNPYYGYVEVLDKNGLHVKEGESGNIVVTSYYNYVMPFIRYDTGDIAEYGGRKNGYVVLNKLHGRSQDYIYNYKHEKYSLTGIVFGQHLEAFKNIVKWQIEQNDLDSIKLKIIKNESFSDKDENELRLHFEEKCCLNTKFDYVDTIELTSSGKFIFLKQNINI